jgi:hypothetical protein
MDNDSAGRVMLIQGKDLSEYRGTTLSAQDLKDAAKERERLRHHEEVQALRKRAKPTCRRCHGKGHLGFDLSRKLFISCRCVG